MYILFGKMTIRQGNIWKYEYKINSPRIVYILL